MKFNSKRAAVCILAICQTTFQFSMAWAQEPGTMKTQTQRSQGMDDLATPTIYGIPQRGTMVKFGYNRAETEYGTETSDAKSSTNTFRTEVVGALSPSFFLGASWEFSKGESNSIYTDYQGSRRSSDSNSEGVSDPTLMAGYRANWPKVSLLSALQASIPTGDYERESREGNSSSANNKEGGAIIDPRLAVFSNDRSSILFGAELSYKIRLERTTKYKSIGTTYTDSYTTKTRGGNSATVTLLMESPLASRYGMGGGLTYMKSEGSTTEYTEKTWSSSSNSYDSDGYDVATGTVYGRIQPTQRLSFVPAVMYARILKTDLGGTSIKSQNIWAGMFQGRYLF
jgi:hypothetical protein